MNDQLVKIVKALEFTIAALLLVAIAAAGILTLKDTLFNFFDGDFRLDVLLESILGLVVGLEFVKMLILHTPESVIEVLLYAVARQVIISHDSALENLIGVSAVAIIFIIRKYLLSDHHAHE